MTSAQPTPTQPMIGGGPQFNQQGGYHPGMPPSYSAAAAPHYGPGPPQQQRGMPMRSMGGYGGYTPNMMPHQGRMNGQPGMMMGQPSQARQMAPDVMMPNQMPNFPNQNIPMYSNQNVNAPYRNRDENNTRSISRQLALLIHAHKCQQSVNSDDPSDPPCGVEYCPRFKNVLAHMIECDRGRACTEGHCASSRQILMHFRHCPKRDCPVCSPLREDSNRNINDVMLPNQQGPHPGQQQNVPQQQQQGGPQHPGQQQSGGGPPPPPSYNHGNSSTHGQPPPPTLQQQQGQGGQQQQAPPQQQQQQQPPQGPQQLSDQKRRHVVMKLVHVICPSTKDAKDSNAIKDKRFQSLYQYAEVSCYVLTLLYISQYNPTPLTQEGHCASSRQILMHFRHCPKRDCPVCSPLREDSNRNINDVMLPNQQGPHPGQQQNVPQQQQQGGPQHPGQQQSGGGPPPPPSYNHGNSSTHGQPPPPTLQQQQGQGGQQQQAPPQQQQQQQPPQGPQQLSDQKRRHVVMKLVHVICPSTKDAKDSNAIKDKRFQSLYQYAEVSCYVLTLLYICKV
eukprot:sb/3463541/